MKILVCGGREFSDNEFVFKMLDPYKPVITQLIEGGARGADALAATWAKTNKIDVRTFPADWDKHGKRAGPLRNIQMLEEGKPDLVVAFPGGKGTTHMVNEARKANVPVIVMFKSPLE